MKLAIQVKRKRSFFRGNRGVSLNIKLQTENNQTLFLYQHFNAFIYQLLAAPNGLLVSLPHERNSSDFVVLTNYRGSSDNSTLHTAGKMQELLFEAKGKFCPTAEKFCIKLLSQFHSLPNPRIIRYEVQPQLAQFSRFIDFNSISLLSCMIGVEIESVQIGLEAFKARHYGAMLGFGPTITSWLNLNISQREFYFNLNEDEWPPNRPLSEIFYVKFIATALHKSGLYKNLGELIDSEDYAS